MTRTAPDADLIAAVREVMDGADAGKVFGAPITQDGTIVLPVAKIGGGGGGGGGTGPAEEGTGTGGGFGVSANRSVCMSYAREKSDGCLRWISTRSSWAGSSSWWPACCWHERCCGHVPRRVGSAPVEGASAGTEPARPAPLSLSRRPGCGAGPGKVLR